MKHPCIEPFMRFIESAPTALFAKQEIAKKLEREGFEKLCFSAPWKIALGGRYFVIKDHSLIAFTVPDTLPKCAKLLLSHLDSPCLKIKPSIEVKHGMALLGTEVYGGPTIASYLDCPMRISGSVFTQEAGKITEHFLDSKLPLAIAVNLAPHLDPERNKTALRIDKQKELKLLLAIDSKESKPQWLKNWLEKEKIKGDLLSEELFATPGITPTLLSEDTLLCAYRLDNLTSAHASLEAIISEKKSNHLNIAIFFDHEEIGSLSRAGAESHFAGKTLSGICRALGIDKWSKEALIEESSALSLDVGHAFTPAFADRFDDQTIALAGNGVALKREAQCRYAFNPLLEAHVKSICTERKIPLQYATNHSNLQGGGTLGNHFAARTGIKTLDCGILLFSMHSRMETCSTKDLGGLHDLAKAYLEESLYGG